MPCKSLPEGICNFPVQLTTDERLEWGKYTYALNARTGSNRSVGDVMREALAIGAEFLDTALGEAVKAARANRAAIKSGIVKSALALIVSISVVQCWRNLDDDMMRRSTHTRVRVAFKVKTRRETV